MGTRANVARTLVDVFTDKGYCDWMQALAVPLPLTVTGQQVFEGLRTRPDDTFVGGSETSTNAIAYGMKLLIKNPHIWSQLKADPDKYMKTFVEEVVRLEGPVQGLMRITTCGSPTAKMISPRRQFFALFGLKQQM